MADIKTVQDYKGFAYIKGNDKPYILFGSSEEYIISRLQNFNLARTQEQKYITVNIGKLVDQQEGADVRYENYKKYEVATGRDISPVYLQLPPLPKEEFKHLTEQLKEKGAKYNAHKKKWYVRPDEMERFKEYLTNPMQKEVIDIQQELQEAMKDEEPKKDVWENKHGIVGLEAQYTLTLQNGRQITVSAGDIPAEYQNKSAGDMLQGIDMVLEEVLGRQETMVEQEPEDYILDMSKDIEINECTVYFPDGRDPMTLYGDQFGVSFASLSKEEAQELVDNYLLHQSDQFQIEDQIEYVIGRPIMAYAYHPVEHSFYPVEGKVLDIDDIEVTLQFSEDKLSVNIPKTQMEYRKEELFSSAQKKWIEDVIKLDISASEYAFMCNGTYTSAQLEAIAESFKDGLRSDQIKIYADSSFPSWKMDLYRIGMQHGISAEKLQDITSNTQDWISGRTQLTAVVKEHRKELSLNITKAGFKPTPEIIKKLEYMNHLTGRDNSVRDVCAAFKQQVYKEEPKLDELVKDLGREFQRQEMAMKQIPSQ